MSNPPQPPWNAGSNTGPSQPSGPQGQPWGGPQSQPSGPQGQPWGGQPMGAPAPKKSKTGLWIAIAGGAVLVVIVAVVLVMTLGGGVAGKERPSLPDEFDGWKVGNHGVYEKDGMYLAVSEQDIAEDERDLKKAMDEAKMDIDVEKVKIDKPGTGIECATVEIEKIETTACAIFYGDEKGFVLAGMPGDFMGGKSMEPKQVHEAAKALAKVKP